MGTPITKSKATRSTKTEFAEFKGGRLRGLAQKQIGKGNENKKIVYANFAEQKSVTLK